MTAKVVGLIDLQRVLAELPEKLERNVLRGAMKDGADVIAEAARAGCRSSEVRESIATGARTKGRVVTAVVQTKGEHAYKAPWLEYGTAGHEIRAKTPEALGRLSRIGSLVIGGSFVGESIWHPGARAYAFMRPALDQHQDDAVTVIGAGIAARLGRINDAFVAAAGEE